MLKTCSAHTETHYLYLPEKKEDNSLKMQANNINKHDVPTAIAAMLTQQKPVYKMKINAIQKVSHRQPFQIEFWEWEHIGQAVGQAVFSHELSSSGNQTGKRNTGSKFRNMTIGS